MRSRRPIFSALRPLALGVALAVTTGTLARAQGPQIEIEGPPGAPEGGGLLGNPIGSAGISRFDTSPGAQEGGPVGGRAGPSVSRVPIGNLFPQQRGGARPERPPDFTPTVAQPAEQPAYGQLEEPASGETFVGPPDGLTIDQAIARLLAQNLSVLALRYEIDQAEADILTAGLRANPVFYADSQLVPYGRYSRQNPGGQTQYDVNVTYPLDVSRKRAARTAVARQAKKVTEAQFQDAVRLQIDNLYTIYVDVVASEQTLSFSKAYNEGIKRIYTLRESQLKSGQITLEATEPLRAQLELAEFQVREATEALKKATRTLALQLNMGPAELEGLRVRDSIRDVRPLPAPAEALVRMGLDRRPDLIAYRLGVGRADAEIRLALANRFSDVYLLYQPYTLQDNRPFGLKSPTSWALGVTVPLPVYNRNQGNIRRAKLNATQTRIELAGLERQVVYDVEQAVREFNISLDAVHEMEREVLPASRRARDLTNRRLLGGQASAIDYLEAQRQFNEVFRQYRDVLIRHRRAMLDLNTAVGARIIP